MEHQTPATAETEQPMSIEIMRNIYKTGAITMDELTLLLDRSEGAVYNYLDRTELKVGQLVRLFRLAESDAVRLTILEALTPGTGFVAMKLPAAADINGDGDVDLDDSLEGASEVITHANRSMRKVIKQRSDEKRVDYSEARAAMQSAAEQALTAVAIFDFLASLDEKRHRLNGRGLRHA